MLIQPREWYNKAMAVYENREIYAPEQARLLFKRSRSLRNMGKSAEADQDDNDCLDLYRQLVPQDRKPLEGLSDRDFDRLIVFWSR